MSEESVASGLDEMIRERNRQFNEKPELPDNISICSDCGKRIKDENETKWSKDAEPFCEECFINNKFILDACCGGRWFWFDKSHKYTLYIDNRIAHKGHDKYRKNHSVEPDIVMDFRDLKFPDKKFKLVVFDPPHMKTLGENSKFKRYYGCLNAETWQEDLRKGFNECWRVLDNHGVLIFKWNESEIPLIKVLNLFSQKPLFGHPTNSKNNTHWLCFMKIPEFAKDGDSERGGK